MTKQMSPEGTLVIQSLLLWGKIKDQSKRAIELVSLVVMCEVPETSFIPFALSTDGEVELLEKSAGARTYVEGSGTVN